MALLRWKDLCIDAAEPALTGGFWAHLLGMRFVAHDDGDGHLEGPSPEHLIWISRVPEPKIVKNRVHLDLRANDIGAILDFGASVHTPPPADMPHWWVLTDPEENEFCVSTKDARDLPAASFELVVDCADPDAQAAWWAAALGAQTAHDDGTPWAYLEGVPALPFDYWVFNPVPEPKTVKNRLHWDVWGVDIDAIVAHGARILRKPDEEINWHVLADPEGNEFCIFPPRV